MQCGGVCLSTFLPRVTATGMMGEGPCCMERAEAPPAACLRQAAGSCGPSAPWSRSHARQCPQPCRPAGLGRHHAWLQRQAGPAGRACCRVGGMGSRAPQAGSRHVLSGGSWEQGLLGWGLVVLCPCEFCAWGSRPYGTPHVTPLDGSLAPSQLVTQENPFPKRDVMGKILYPTQQTQW